MTAAIAEPTVGDVLLDDQWVGVDVIEATRPDGSTFPHRRVRLGSGRGTHVCCLVGEDVVLVRQPRPVIGAQANIELPGGGTADDSVTEALREFTEESGIPITDILDVRLLGYLHQAAGLASNRGTAWLAIADPRAAASMSLLPELESGAVPFRLPFRQALDDARITDAMTLATLHLAERYLRRRDPRPG